MIGREMRKRKEREVEELERVKVKELHFAHCNCMHIVYLKHMPIVVEKLQCHLRLSRKGFHLKIFDKTE